MPELGMKMPMTVQQVSLALSERLRRGLEEDILSGRLAPGDELDERSLAARYGVSRTPVREALLQLSTIGLVTVRPRQSTRISTIDLTRLMQMTEVMASLEAQAAELAARRMSESKRRELLALHEEAADMVKKGDRLAFNDANWRLHLAILSGSQNAFLEETARVLRLRLHPYRCFIVRQRGRMESAFHEHSEIVSAICESNSELAFRLMRQHLAIDADLLADLASTLKQDGTMDLQGDLVISA
jgi:DNA-binding GntR family transcriptional regulator